MKALIDPCPCDVTRPYAACCGQYHAGAVAPTAEALMRSRYSAYAKRLGDYLLSSWHESTRPAELEMDEAPGARLQWLGLQVKSHTLLDEDHAIVSFTARFRLGGNPAQRMHEVSRFLKEEGRWFYLEGDVA